MRRMIISKIMGLINRAKSPQPTTAEALTQQELQFILKALANAKFDGRDVLLLSGIVQKLSDSIESE